eukprot:Rmarinus@m.21894
MLSVLRHSRVLLSASLNSVRRMSQEPQSFARRDLLRSLEHEAQTKWEKTKPFNLDAPKTYSEKNKFLGTFPYPYMNGFLHLGHAFSLTKVEFLVAYERMKGKDSLWPFGLHCTGMPIKACADKLKRELEVYGCPPTFPEEEVSNTNSKDLKSKAAAKTGGVKYQWTILEQSGIPTDEIAKFVDPLHWLKYFPPNAIQDLKAMGCQIDWRRSFITTDVNPYYDSFIRWQFMKLKEANKIRFGKRLTVYSLLDGQGCADHDRAEGEGVEPQNYTLIKMQIPYDVLEEKHTTMFASIRDAGYKLFLGAATLRPETMYGQTNCWILPEGEYGAYETQDQEAIIMSERAALNLSCQGYGPEFGKPKCLGKFTGNDLMGVPLDSPNAPSRIHTLPMMTISMNKGTGIVTSVPSDAPDDWAALRDLQKKDKLREKFGIKEEWCPEPIPIIQIPGFETDMAAAELCTKMKIQSQNDRVKLADAKDQVYLKGFTDGVMLVGDFKGKKVSEAKPLLKEQLIAEGKALPYSEPEKKVVSRSGDECVVAYCNQWFLGYGEEEWRKLTEKCLQNLNTYSSEVRHQFEHTLSWLKDWGCSRSFGLGTRLPWDDEFLVESLSDSTIYMAYYTVAHLLQGGVLDGSQMGPAGIKAEQMTPEVWDFVMLGKDYPADCGIPKEKLDMLRNEFEYWYPVDIRPSGKDLIMNHLTMFLYNHTAIFPEDKWPRAVRANGHLMMNGSKMSKSLGNFLTLRQAIEKYSADAMRFALADAGDSVDDANFAETIANAAILRLTTFLAFAEESVKNLDSLRTGATDSFADKVFTNDLNYAIAETDRHYRETNFREALKTAFFELQNARDEYIKLCGSDGMHRDLVSQFLEVQALLLAPICPHICEKVYDMLHPGQSVVVARFPEAGPVDNVLRDVHSYLESQLHNTRLKIQGASKKKKGPELPKATKAIFHVASEYKDWQQLVLKKLRAVYDQHGSIPKDITKQLASDPELKPHMKLAMPFASMVKGEVEKRGLDALALTTPFDEAVVLNDNLSYITTSLGLNEVQVVKADAGSNATPGKPVVILE